MYKGYEAETSLKLIKKGIEIAQAHEAEIQQEALVAPVGSERAHKIHSKLTDSQRTICQAYCTAAEIMMNMPAFPKNKGMIFEALNKA